MFFNLIKVRTFWETHKIWKKSSSRVLTNQLIYVKTMRKIFSNYVCFSKSPNFHCSIRFFWWNGEKNFLRLSTFTDTAAIEKIYVDYGQTLLKLFNGDNDNFPFVFAKSDVDADDLSIFVHTAPKDRNTMEVHNS